MTERAIASEKYRETLLLYFEEEIMGEAYFYGLAKRFDGPGEHEKLVLLAGVERHAAEAVRPLLLKHGLTPRSDDVLGNLEAANIETHGAWSWKQLTSYMAERYPLYMDDFEGLERMAPAEDLPLLRFLTAHETAAIKFAQMEVNGENGSDVPLRHYLASDPPASPGTILE